MRHRALLLQTPRLLLRPFDEADLDAVLPLLCHPQVSATYMLPDFVSPAQAEPLFRRLLALSRMPERFVYAIALNGQVIGFLNEVSAAEGVIELGYVIHPAHWGCGYATEALTAAIGELHRMGLRAVRAGYFAGNDASRRVMEKAGMTPVDNAETVEYRGQVREVRYMVLDLG